MKHAINTRIILALGLGLTLAALCLSLNPGLALSKAPAAELHVCPAGCPYSSVQAAVDAANEGDIIKVATGVYTDMSVRPRNAATTDVVTQVVYISKTVTIQGGYTTAFTEPPDPTANPTTLDAQGQGRVLYIRGEVSPTIDGFNMTGGYDRSCGGGIYANSSALTLGNNYIFNNHTDDTFAGGSGGGMAIGFSNAILYRNRIISNSAYVCGGVLLENYSGLIPSNGTVPYYTGTNLLTGNTIVSNTSSYAGGICLSAARATLSDNIISGNAATLDGGGIKADFSQFTMTANTISANQAGKNAGGLFLFYGTATIENNLFVGNAASSGGGLGLSSTLSPTLIRGNTILSNTARYGGGVIALGNVMLDANIISFNTATEKGGGMSVGGEVTITRSIITFNTSQKNGGGLSISAGAPLFVNNVIADNQASATGGGIYATDPSNPSWGPISPNFWHTTIARNSSGDGSGVYIVPLNIGTPNQVALTNTILVSQSVGITVADGSNAILNGVLWFGNGANTGGVGIITITHEITGDPAFAPDGYHLITGSAAIDQGVEAGVTRDLDGQARPHGVAPDLGADEYWLLDKHIYLPLVLRQSP